MKSINKGPRTTSSMLEWLDSVRMTEPNRQIAKNQVRMAEAVIDAAWRAAGYVRAVIARAASAKPAKHGKAAGKLGSQDRIASDLR